MPQGLSDLAPLRFRPDCRMMCITPVPVFVFVPVPVFVFVTTRIAWNAERSLLWRPGEGRQTPFLLPNWRIFAVQLASNFSPVSCLHGIAFCAWAFRVPRSIEANRGCNSSILSTNQSFFYANHKSTSRARDKLVFINLKNRCFLPLLSSPGLKTGQTVVGCAGANRFQWTRDTVDALANAS